MRIGVISDTHGHIAHTQNAVKTLKEHRVERILHCGDVGEDEIVSQFEQWPTHFVAGNCDYSDQLGEIVKSNQQIWEGLFGDLLLNGKRIALLHSHEQQRFDQAIHSGEYDLVCYGHTHVLDHRIIGETHVLNPGAMYRATQFTVAVVDLETMEISHVEVPCNS